MTSVESKSLHRKVLQEILANEPCDLMSEKPENEIVNLSERRTILVKNSFSKVKKGAVLFESRNVKAKLNDKKSNYNHETKVLARMVAEVLVLDKTSGDAVAAVVTLNLEEKSLSLNCFGEDREAFLSSSFLEPFLLHLEREDERGEVRQGGKIEENWRETRPNLANGRGNDNWRPRNAREVEVIRKAEVTPPNSWPKAKGEVGLKTESKVIEHRMAKLALAEIGKQKLRDDCESGVRQQGRKVESEEKARLRAARKKVEEDKKKKDDESRMREAEMKKMEEQNALQVENISSPEGFWQELLDLVSEDGVALMRKRELEEGWSKEEMARGLLNALCNMAIKEGEELVNKEEEDVKGEKRRVSFEDKDVENRNPEEKVNPPSNEKKGILKSPKISVSNKDLEKEVVKRWETFL